MTRGIYRIRNTVTGECYVGKSRNIERRWGEHRTMLKHSYNENPRLAIAAKQHGIEALAFDTLEVVLEDISLGEREQYYINLLEPVYNSYMGVHGLHGGVVADRPPLRDL